MAVRVDELQDRVAPKSREFVESEQVERVAVGEADTVFAMHDQAGRRDLDEPPVSRLAGPGPFLGDRLAVQGPTGDLGDEQEDQQQQQVVSRLAGRLVHEALQVASVVEDQRVEGGVQQQKDSEHCGDEPGDGTLRQHGRPLSRAWTGAVGAVADRSWGGTCARRETRSYSTPGKGSTAGARRTCPAGGAGNGGGAPLRFPP